MRTRIIEWLLSRGAGSAMVEALIVSAYARWTRAIVALCRLHGHCPWYFVEHDQRGGIRFYRVWCRCKMFSSPIRGAEREGGIIYMQPIAMHRRERDHAWVGSFGLGDPLWGARTCHTLQGLGAVARWHEARWIVEDASD